MAIAKEDSKKHKFVAHDDEIYEVNIAEYCKYKNEQITYDDLMKKAKIVKENDGGKKKCK